MWLAGQGEESFLARLESMASSPGVVAKTMVIQRLNPSQHGVLRDGGVRLPVFFISLVFIGMVKFGAVDAQDGLSLPLSALAPSAIPPPPPLTPLQQSQEVVQALRVNNFTTAAQLLQTYLPILRLNSTLFVPTNAALASASAATPILTLLLYHVTRPQYTFDQLSALPIGTRLATSLGNNSVVVTHNDSSNYQVDGVRIVVADVCASSTINLEISCHGVEGVLNETLYGDPTSASAGVPFAAPAPSAGASSPPVPFVIPGPPTVPLESPEGIPGTGSTPRSLPTGGASVCRVRIPFRQVAYVVFLGLLCVSFGS